MYLVFIPLKEISNYKFHTILIFVLLNKLTLEKDKYSKTLFVIYYILSLRHIKYYYICIYITFNKIQTLCNKCK